MRGALQRLGRAPLFAALSEPPNGGGRFLHHGARIGLLLALAALITAFFPPTPGLDVPRYELGAVATQDVIAQFQFAVRKSDDELRREQIEAAAAVPPTFNAQPQVTDSVLGSVSLFFDRLEEFGGGEEAVPGVEALVQGEGITATPEQVALLTDPGTRNAMRRAATSAIRELLPMGVIEAWTLELSRIERFKVRTGDAETTVPASEVLFAREFYDAALQRLPAQLATPDGEQMLRLILIRHLRPTLVLDSEVTDREKAQARDAVPVTKANIVPGEAIVRANQRVGESELERLNAYIEQSRNRGALGEGDLSFARTAGSFLFTTLLLTIYGLVVLLYRREVYTNFRWILLHATLIASYFAVATLVGLQDRPELLPIAFVALVVAVLWDGRLAFVLTVVLALLTGSLGPFSSYEVVAIVAVAGAVASLSVRAVRRRSQTWIFVALIALAYAVAILFLGLAGERPWGSVAASVTWGGLSALASAILAMGFLPLLEWFTGITTDQTLLEWADPNRPLLRRLSMEAPGTYAHTINVANLAEAAANAIGANGLLCRVGTYYHDVGKSIKPQYFIENQPGGQNPHDRLKPQTSAAIVREHVIEGRRLAEEAGVPEAIADFISEHHGTQRISFFYEKALEEADDPDDIDLSLFTYPGPRPKSRETAILMIADSVESATRTLQDPTAERIGDLVESIVHAKIEEGQLDEAPLTLSEIARLEAQFVKVLRGMYHQRIDYPSTKHLTESPDVGVPGPLPTGH